MNDPPSSLRPDLLFLFPAAPRLGGFTGSSPGSNSKEDDTLLEYELGSLPAAACNRLRALPDLSFCIIAFNLSALDSALDVFALVDGGDAAFETSA